jgi:hypothetical protein
MYRKTIFVTGALTAVVPILATGCVPSRSARMARWEMPSAMDDAKATESPAKEEPKGASTSDSPSKTATDEQHAGEAGRSVRHLPASCDQVAYVNVKALGESEPISANESGIRDRVMVFLDQHKEIGAALHLGLEALHSKGLYWRRDLEEASVCFEKGQVKALVVAGSFEASDLVQALRSWATQAGGSAQIVDHEGHSYAMVGKYYAAQIGTGMVAVGAEMAVIDDARADGPGLVARGGEQNSLVLVRTKRPSGREITASLVSVGNDTLVVNTTVEKSEGTFDPAQDRAPLRAEVDRIADVLRDSPLTTLAEDIARTDIFFAGHTARLRTEVSKTELREGISKAAAADSSVWDNLRERWVTVAAGKAAPKEPEPIKISTPAPSETPPAETKENKENKEADPPADGPAADPKPAPEHPEPEHPAPESPAPDAPKGE